MLLRIRASASISIACALALLSTSAPVAAGVVVVGPGESFTQIDAAVAAAAAGDVLLVETGSYDPVTISGKGLAIVADAGASVTVLGGIMLDALPSGQTVLLDHLKSQGLPTVGLPDVGLSVSNCAGAVRIEHCVLGGSNGDAVVLPNPSCEVVGTRDAGTGVRITGSGDVALVSCTITGGIGSSLWDDTCALLHDLSPTGGLGGDAIDLDHSSVTVQDSTLLGGAGGSGGAGNQGGRGAHAGDASTLLLIGAAATGGYGGQSFDGLISGPGGSGDSGLVTESGANVHSLDSTYFGGVQGPGFGDPGGTLAPAIDGSGSFTAWTGHAKHLDMATVLREGQVILVHLTGDVGDVALLFLSPGSVGTTWFKAKGSLIVDLAQLTGPLVLGPLSSGSLTLGAVLPALPAGVQDIELYVQPLFTGSAGPTLGGWVHFTWLDSAF